MDKIELRAMRKVRLDKSQYSNLRTARKARLLVADTNLTFDEVVKKLATFGINYGDLSEAIINGYSNGSGNEISWHMHLMKESGMVTNKETRVEIGELLNLAGAFEWLERSKKRVGIIEERRVARKAHLVKKADEDLSGVRERPQPEKAELYAKAAAEYLKRMKPAMEKRLNELYERVTNSIKTHGVGDSKAVIKEIKKAIDTYGFAAFTGKIKASDEVRHYLQWMKDPISEALDKLFEQVESKKVENSAYILNGIKKSIAKYGWKAFDGHIVPIKEWEMPKSRAAALRAARTARLNKIAAKDSFWFLIPYSWQQSDGHGFRDTALVQAPSEKEAISAFKDEIEHPNEDIWGYPAKDKGWDGPEKADKYHWYMNKSCTCGEPGCEEGEHEGDTVEIAMHKEKIQEFDSKEDAPETKHVIEWPWPADFEDDEE